MIPIKYFDNKGQPVYENRGECYTGMNRNLIDYISNQDTTKLKIKAVLKNGKKVDFYDCELYSFFVEAGKKESKLCFVFDGYNILDCEG